MNTVAHRTTDPACMVYQPPRVRLSIWWHLRQRGKACGPCSALRYDAAARSDAEKFLEDLTPSSRLVGTLSAHLEPLCAEGRLQCEECQAAGADLGHGS